jgi:hypothetical protein
MVSGSRSVQWATSKLLSSTFWAPRNETQVLDPLWYLPCRPPHGVSPSIQPSIDRHWSRVQLPTSHTGSVFVCVCFLYTAHTRVTPSAADGYPEHVALSLSVLVEEDLLLLSNPNVLSGGPPSWGLQHRGLCFGCDLFYQFAAARSWKADQRETSRVAPPMQIRYGGF